MAGGALDSIKGLTGGLSGGVMAAGAYAAAIVAVGAAYSKLYQAGQETVNEIEQVNAQFGIVGVTAEESTKSVSELYKAGVGENIADAYKSATELKSILEMQGLSIDPTYETKVLKTIQGIATATGKDVGEINQMFAKTLQLTGGDMEEALSIMSYGVAKIKSPTDDLNDSVVEYSRNALEAGYSASEFYGILEAGAKAGIQNTDLISDTIKEISATLKDGTISSKLEEIGKTATGSFKEVSKELETLTKSAFEGDISQKEFIDTYTKNVTKAFESGEITKAQQDNLLLAFGGTKMEDLTTTAWLNIQKNAKVINKEIAQDIQTNFENLSNQNVQGFDGLKRELELVTVDIFAIFQGPMNDVFNSITDLIKPMIPTFLKISELIGSIFRVAVALFKAAIQPIIIQVQVLTSFLNPIIDIVKGILEPFIAIYEAIVIIWETIRKELQPLLEELFGPMEDGAQSFKEAMEALTPLIIKGGQAFANWIVKPIRRAIELINSMKKGLSEFLGLGSGDGGKAEKFIKYSAGLIRAGKLTVEQLKEQVKQKIVNGKFNEEDIKYLGAHNTKKEYAIKLGLKEVDTLRHKSTLGKDEFASAVRQLEIAKENGLLDEAGIARLEYYKNTHADLLKDTEKRKNTEKEINKEISVSTPTPTPNVAVYKDAYTPKFIEVAKSIAEEFNLAFQNEILKSNINVSEQFLKSFIGDTNLDDIDFLNRDLIYNKLESIAPGIKNILEDATDISIKAELTPEDFADYERQTKLLQDKIKKIKSEAAPTGLTPDEINTIANYEKTMTDIRSKYMSEGAKENIIALEKAITSGDMTSLNEIMQSLFGEDYISGLKKNIEDINIENNKYLNEELEAKNKILKIDEKINDLDTNDKFYNQKKADYNEEKTDLENQISLIHEKIEGNEELNKIYQNNIDLGYLEIQNLEDYLKYSNLSKEQQEELLAIYEKQTEEQKKSNIEKERARKEEIQKTRESILASGDFKQILGSLISNDEDSLDWDTLFNIDGLSNTEEIIAEIANSLVNTSRMAGEALYGMFSGTAEEQEKAQKAILMSAIDFVLQLIEIVALEAMVTQLKNFPIGAVIAAGIMAGLVTLTAGAEALKAQIGGAEDGGIVSEKHWKQSRPGSTDKYPYMLAAGEGVVNAKAMSIGANKEFFEMMNKGIDLSSWFVSEQGLNKPSKLQSINIIPEKYLKNKDNQTELLSSINNKLDRLDSLQNIESNTREKTKTNVASKPTFRNKINNNNNKNKIDYR